MRLAWRGKWYDIVEICMAGGAAGNETSNYK
jgi:hypothetical protein